MIFLTDGGSSVLCHRTQAGINQGPSEVRVLLAFHTGWLFISCCLSVAHTTVGTYFASMKKKHTFSFFTYFVYQTKWMITDLNIPQSFSEEMLFFLSL